MVRAGDDSLSRRRFVVGAAGATAVGAAVWVAPQMTSVALAQEATPGSPPPDDGPIDDVGEPESPPITDRPRIDQPVDDEPVDDEPADRAGGSLPVTGAESRTLVVAGLVGMVLGRALLSASTALGEPDPADRPGR